MRKISSFALFAFLMPLAGCPSDDTGDDGAGSTSVTPPATEDTAATDTPATDDGTATEPPSTDDGVTDDGVTDDTTTGGGGAGFCGTTCAAAADCVPPMGNEADWACTEGFCEFLGELPACDDTTCPAAAGYACAMVDGNNVCTLPCTAGGTECDLSMQECTGTDDAGNSICQAPPCGGAAEGAPCEIAGVQFGTCTDGVCSCTDDAECTGMNQGCNS